MDNVYEPFYEIIIENSTDIFNLTDVNTTIEGEESQIYFFYQKEQLAFLWMLFIMIVAGNSAVLVALMLSKNRKSRMNFFIMHLAIADLSVGVINVLTDIIWKITVKFYADNIVCKLVKYLQALVTYSSTYVLVALSIDRYDAIAHPMNFSTSWRKARILIAASWGTSALFSIPSLFLSRKEIVNDLPQCWIDLQSWQWQIYMTLIAISLFFLPALIIAGCYTVIVYTIWTKSRLMSYPKLNKSSSIVDDKKKSCTNKANKNNKDQDVDRKRASSRGIIPRAKIKTVKMTLVIVFVFILCWSPYFVYDLLQVYGQIPPGKTSNAISTFIQSLAPLNSAANPMIYCLFSTHICRNFRRLPFCNWIAQKLCVCFPSMQRPLPESQYRASEYTTMTETMSTHHRNSTIHQQQHYQMTAARGANRSLLKQVSTNSSDGRKGTVVFGDVTASATNSGTSNSRV